MPERKTSKLNFSIWIPNHVTSVIVLMVTPFATSLLTDRMQISGSELGALGVFCSYFSIIAGLFWVIWTSLSGSATNLGRRAYVFIALALGSFAHTWFCERVYCLSSRLANPEL
jgi:hypothetical protein